MLKRSIIIFALLFLTAPAFAEDEPTMHQVYLAAEAGKFNEAQAMMDKVLKAHPNSAKAHFVEAELLAKQGLFSGAGVELSTAERLQPGLPFAKSEAVTSLKNRIASVSNRAAQPNIGAQAQNQNIQATLTEWMPAILLILGIGLVVMLIGFFSRRNANAIPANSYAGNGLGANMAVGPNGSVMGQPATGGMGSGIIGNLATGAALGAGVVAGEALMHRFIDGDKNEVTHEPPRHDNSPWSAPSTSHNIGANDDMGGTDFGIADASSWDDDVASDDSDDTWT